MNIAICGANGFIGSRLAEAFGKQGDTVVPLGRALFSDRQRSRLEQLIRPCEVVVNVAGAPIDKRWTTAYKQTLYASRVGVTRRLVEAINSGGATRLFISASAVGIYPHVGCYDEGAMQQGHGFLARLCAAWEHEARQLRGDVRLAVTRFGVVLAPHGGAFARLARMGRLKTEAVIGNGWQPLSWIDREDLVRAIIFLTENGQLSGTFNFTAPERLTQKEFMREVARHYGALLLPVPGFAVKMFYGEASQFLLQGQCAVPARLTEAGFEFLTPDLDTFLRRLGGA